MVNGGWGGGAVVRSPARSGHEWAIQTMNRLRPGK